MRGELKTPATYESHRLQLAHKIWAEPKANDSAECRSCHTPSQMAFSKQPADAERAHQSLKQSGMTCNDCHQGVAHTPCGCRRPSTRKGVSRGVSGARNRVATSAMPHRWTAIQRRRVSVARWEYGGGVPRSPRGTRRTPCGCLGDRGLVEIHCDSNCS